MSSACYVSKMRCSGRRTKLLTMIFVSPEPETGVVVVVALAPDFVALVDFCTPPTGAALVTRVEAVPTRRPRPRRPTVLRRVLRMSSRLLSSLFSDILIKMRRQSVCDKSLDGVKGLRFDTLSQESARVDLCHPNIPTTDRIESFENGWSGFRQSRIFFVGLPRRCDLVQRQALYWGYLVTTGNAADGAADE